VNQTVKRIQQAARRREKADRARREATAQLRELCRQAQSEGISITEIAREAGLSRQGVYDLLAARPS
jgi:DNA invertase Pin-like site-specific DNA recombinase